MKNIYLKVIQKLIFLAGLVFIACEAPNQPTYDEDHPDPNPTGKQAPILNLITPSEGYLNQIVTIEAVDLTQYLNIILLSLIKKYPKS